jgi:hypothetical protein
MALHESQMKATSSFPGFKYDYLAHLLPHLQSIDDPWPLILPMILPVIQARYVSLSLSDL